MALPTLDPNVTLIVVALLNCITSIFTWRTHKVVKDSADVIDKLEKNTNSIKDALVKSTGEAAFSAGRAKGRKEEENRVSSLSKEK